MIANSTSSHPGSSNQAQASHSSGPNSFASLATKPAFASSANNPISHASRIVRSLKRTTSALDNEDSSEDENQMNESKEASHSNSNSQPKSIHAHKRIQLDSHHAPTAAPTDDNGNSAMLVSSSAANSADAEEDSFFDLLSHFASLDLPSAADDNTPHTEPCPICAMPFELTQYARHVYQCIQADEDLRFAQQISESDLYDQELNAVVMRSIMMQDQHARQQEMKRLLKLRNASLSASAASSPVKSASTAEGGMKDDSGDPGQSESAASDLVDDAIQRIRVERHTSEGQTSEGQEQDSQVEGKVEENQDEDDESASLAQAIAKSLQARATASVSSARLAELAQRTVLEKVKSSSLNVSACADGSSCKRTDAQHFLLKLHPEVSCPICESQFAPYEIDAHVTQCLTAESKPSTQQSATSVPQSFAHIGSSNTQSASASASAASAEKSSAQSSASLPNFSMSAFNSSSFRSAPRQTANSLTSPRLTSSCADDDFKSDGMNSSQHTSAVTTRIGANLTVTQASIMARSLLQHQASASSSSALKSNSADGAEDGEDPSLRQLLETFRTLGFNKENLSNLKSETQQSRVTSPTAMQQQTQQQQQQQQPSDSNSMQ